MNIEIVPAYNYSQEINSLFSGDRENTELGEIFGLDAETKELLENNSD